jgi:predicted DNA binding protein
VSDEDVLVQTANGADSVDQDDEWLNEELSRKARRKNRTKISRPTTNECQWEPNCDGENEGPSEATLVAIPLSITADPSHVLYLETEWETHVSREATVTFDLLGTIVGQVIEAADRRGMVHADRAVELEMETHDPKSLLGRITERLDCQCWLVYAKSTADGEVLNYVSFAGTTAQAVASTLDEFDSVLQYRTVEQRPEEFVIELQAGEPTTVGVAKTGGSVCSVVAREGVVTLVVQLPQQDDIHSFLDRFRSVYPDTKLVTKRDVELPVETMTEYRQTVASQLTERQQTVLESAFVAGYYDWPRNSTGEEIAAALGIAPSTFQQHLREAERKILSALLDGTGDVAIAPTGFKEP